VSRLRTTSTRRLVLMLAFLVALATAAAVLAVAASGGGGPTPPPKPLAEALHDAVTAPETPGITARIKFTNDLFPSGSLLGSAGSALMSGASGRLWLTNDGRGRLELQSDAGDVQVVWRPGLVTAYDASSNTVYRVQLPVDAAGADASNSRTPPSLAEIQDFLSKLADHANVSDAQPSDVAGQPAYTVTVSPKHDGGLLGSAQLAWDAVQGVPLRIGIYAQGSSSPVLELTATEISYGAVSSSDVDVSPPSGAKVVDLDASHGPSGAGGTGSSVTGLDAVQAAATFPVTAPDQLVGLPRKDVRLVGGSDSKAVLALYGQGLGGVVVVERPADSSGGSNDALASLPTVAIGGTTVHELATQLGTVLEWRNGSVEYVLAGSMPPAAAEAAARALQ
jgi:outer membrane lipoprotein-sorting protein